MQHAVGETLSGSVGEWVLVSYNGQFFHGEIAKLKAEEAKVNCVRKIGFNGNLYCWPTTRDCIWYAVPSDNIRKLSPPIAYGARGRFRFLDEF